MKKIFVYVSLDLILIQNTLFQRLLRILIFSVFRPMLEILLRSSRLPGLYCLNILNCRADGIYGR